MNHSIIVFLGVLVLAAVVLFFGSKSYTGLVVLESPELFLEPKEEEFSIMGSSKLFVNAEGTVGFIDDGSVNYVHSDFVGSNVLVSNDYEYEKTEYLPFGNVYSTDSSYEYLFHGREALSNIGLYENTLRQFDPGIGRFTQTDPVLRSTESNYYFVKNNPLVNVDPEGSVVLGEIPEGTLVLDPVVVEADRIPIKREPSNVNPWREAREEFESLGRLADALDKAAWESYDKGQYLMMAEGPIGWVGKGGLGIAEGIFMRTAIRKGVHPGIAWLSWIEKQIANKGARGAIGNAARVAVEQGFLKNKALRKVAESTFRNPEHSKLYADFVERVTKGNIHAGALRKVISDNAGNKFFQYSFVKNGGLRVLASLENDKMVIKAVYNKNLQNSVFRKLNIPLKPN